MPRRMGTPMRRRETKPFWSSTVDDACVIKLADASRMNVGRPEEATEPTDEITDDEDDATTWCCCCCCEAGRVGPGPWYMAALRPPRFLKMRSCISSSLVSSSGLSARLRTLRRNSSSAMEPLSPGAEIGEPTVNSSCKKNIFFEQGK